MVRNLLLLLTLSLLGVLPARADETFSFKAGFASLDADGSFAADNGGSGTRLSFDGNIDFGNSEDVILEGAAQLGRFRFSAEYLPLGFSGSGTLTRDVTFDGRTFSSGSRVTSDVDLEVFDLGAAFHLIDVDDGPVRLQLGPSLGVKIADVGLFLEDSSSGARESLEATFPVPTIGARGRLAFGDYLGVVGRANYLEIGDSSYLDADIQLEYSPVPLVGIFAGYRYMDLDVNESDVVLKSTLGGPYAGLLMRF